MRRRTLLRAAATGGVAGLAALAGCAGGGAQGTTTEQPTTTTTTTTTTETAATGTATTAASATVTVRSHPEYGDVLVDAAGMTLYLFTRDRSVESTCYDSCARNWPPLTVAESPTRGPGVTAELGTIERRDGSLQVVAEGHPLYRYARDERPGDAKGQGVGGVWFVVAPDGTQVGGEGTATGTTTTGTTTTGTTTTTPGGVY